MYRSAFISSVGAFSISALVGSGSASAEPLVPPMSPQECKQLAEAVGQAAKARNEQVARRLIQEGRARCPDPNSVFTLALAVVEGIANNWDISITLFRGVLTSKQSNQSALDTLIEVYKEMPEYARRNVRALGMSEADRLYVPSVRAARIWIDTFGCMRGRPMITDARAYGAAKELATIYISCASDGIQRMLYFKYANPAGDPAKPSTDQAKPGADQAKPGADQAKPGADQAKPNLAKAGAEPAKAGADQAKPSSEPTKKAPGPEPAKEMSATDPAAKFLVEEPAKPVKPAKSRARHSPR